MEYGVFLPIAKNGFIVSKNSPQFMPTWELNKHVTQKCEALGFGFALSMIKHRGFGGPTEYWDYAHDSFTLMAALAGVTERIVLIPSIATLTINPAIVARMSVSLDHASNGRFGLNIVSGWYKSEYDQMGMWPGESHFERRYDLATEYVTILRDLWSTGRCTLNGEFFQMKSAQCLPLPISEIEIVCAGQSSRGMRFTAEMGDRNFIIGELAALPDMHARLQAEAEKANRKVGSIGLFQVITGETDEEAQARFEHFLDGADMDAIGTMGAEMGQDPSEGMARSVMAKAVFMGFPLLVGSYENVAAQLNGLEQSGYLSGAMLAFPDFVDDLEVFGSHVIPLLERQPAGVS